jgi:hypothetical protein
LVLGRREISAILLALGALLFYFLLLSSSASEAQLNFGTTDNVIIDETIDEFIDEEITEDVIIDVDREPRKKQPTIINVPKKPLPPSGGPPMYGVVASFILAGTGLLALGIGIRRGLRR